MDDLERHLRDSGKRLLGLRGPLVAGEPWRLSEAWGTEPEADWGPREVLAHVHEMLDYWREQLGHVLAADPTTVPQFGRVASDSARIRRIGEGRTRPAGEQLDGIDVALDRACTFVGRLSPADLERRGAHPTRGEVTVGAAVERFLLTHLDEHVEQLDAILARRTS